MAIILFSKTYAFGDESVSVLVNDKGVSQDTYYPGCFWEHCKKKAEKLKLNYLKTRIYREFKKSNIKVLAVEDDNYRLEDGLIITVTSGFSGSGRGYFEFAAETVTFGAAPIFVKAIFRVKYEVVKAGKTIHSYEEVIRTKRNISVLSDTQKYKEKVAKKIVKTASKILAEIKST